MKKVTLSGLLATAFVFGAFIGIAGTAHAQAPATDWNGLYVGVNVGAARNHDTGLVECINSSGVQNGAGCLVQGYGKTTASGGVAGGQIGYNWQFNRFVVGPEVDFDTSTLTGRVAFGGPLPCISAATVPGTFSATETPGWIGTARLRLGYAFSPKSLVYLTGGYARGNGNVQSNILFTGGNQYVANLNIQQNGTIAGVGTEWKFDPNKAIRFELLDFNLPKFTSNAFNTGSTTGFQNGKDFIFHGWVLRGGVDIKI